MKEAADPKSGDGGPEARSHITLDAAAEIDLMNRETLKSNTCSVGRCCWRRNGKKRRELEENETLGATEPPYAFMRRRLKL